jgi:hypothetical protein
LRNANTVLVGKAERKSRHHLGDQVLDGRIILKWIIDSWKVIFPPPLNAVLIFPNEAIKDKTTGAFA